MALDIIVRKPGPNVYSVDFVFSGTRDRINKNGYFCYNEIDKHIVLMGQTGICLDNADFCCVAVAHDNVELQKRLREEISDHVTHIWEDNRKRGLGEVIDETGEGILNGWRRPVVMPDD